MTMLKGVYIATHSFQALVNSEAHQPI